MHIPEGVLSESTSMVTTVGALTSGVGIMSAILRVKIKPSMVQLGTVAAFVFAGQMINYPILPGVSAHLLGTTLAVVLLGVPWGILTMSLVLGMQCLLFSDGGLFALGSNIINMALIGGVVSGLGVRWAHASDRNVFLKYGVVAFLATMAMAISCGGMLLLSHKTLVGSGLMRDLMWTHIFVGLGEAFLTVGVLQVLAFLKPYVYRWNIRLFIWALSAAILLILSAMGSGWPDGLMHIMQKYSLLTGAEIWWLSLWPDYSVMPIMGGVGATGMAVMIGMIIVGGLMAALGLLASGGSLRGERSKGYDS